MKPGILLRVVLTTSVVIAATGAHYMSAVAKQPVTQEPALRSAKKPVTPALSCSISANKTVFKVGEIPKIQVRIKNEQEKAIYLVGSLDGSEDKMRYPYCYFEIRNAKGQLVRPKYGLCGTSNPLGAHNFSKVQPKAYFDPYAAGFWSPNIFSFDKNLLKPGEYQVRFIYSTENPNIREWLGAGTLGIDKRMDAIILERFSQVPKLTVTSNELTIKVVK